MRIVVDLQGAQSASRFRGIGRYSLALALGLARNAGEHEIWLLLNGAMGEAIEPIRRAFAGLVPPERMRVLDIATPCAEHEPAHGWRTRANERIREYALAELEPDVVLVTSLFEGYVDDAVVSVEALGARTAVVLYDLIPFLKPDLYLGTQAQRDYYERKIASLRRAGLLLSISDYSRQEALDALHFPPERIVSISTAIDQRFCPAPFDPAALAALNARFGIHRPTVLYAPGGFDARKNIDGLISAYARLPQALRVRHQLLIASKIDAGVHGDLLRHARAVGLASDELLFTDYVDDDTLIALYRSAYLFVFPSRHEGFGLPALEAMACGAPVIGGDNSSLPEVIGLAEAMFDADDIGAIAQRLEQVLADPALRERLREHGAQQALRFSWDHTAQRALRAIEARWGGDNGPRLMPAPAAPAADQAPPQRARRRLAFVSPLPPERTGIADYAAQCLDALADWFDLELIVHQATVELPLGTAQLPMRDLAWFEAHALRPGGVR